MVLLAALPAYAGELGYDGALAFKKEGNYKKAEVLFQKLLKKDEANPELWFQLGLMQRFLGEFNAALMSQQKALALSPENDDIKLELARLYHFTGNNSVAEGFVESILEKTPTYQEAIVLKERINHQQNLQAVAPFEWQFDFGYENSSFSRQPQPDWRQYFLQIGHWLQKNTFVHVRFEDVERFNRHNTYYEAGIGHIFNEVYNGYVHVGHTPNSSFIPQWRFKVGGEVRLVAGHSFIGESWFTLSTQHDRYTNLNTTVIKPGVRYAFNKHWQLHAQHINVVDENSDHLQGWSARVDWQPSSPVRFFAGASNAPETENAITVDTKSHFIGAVYQLTPEAQLHLSYAREDRENSFIRNIISTTITVKF